MQMIMKKMKKKNRTIKLCWLKYLFFNNLLKIGLMKLFKLYFLPPYNTLNIFGY